MSLKSMRNKGTMPGVKASGIVSLLGNVYGKGQNGNVYSVFGICPTILSGETNNKCNGGIGSSNAPKILIKEEIR